MEGRSAARRAVGASKARLVVSLQRDPHRCPLTSCQARPNQEAGEPHVEAAASRPVQLRQRPHKAPHTGWLKPQKLILMSLEA